MPLDPDVSAFLESLAALGNPPMHELTADEARAAFAAFPAFLGEPEPVASVEDRTIPGPTGDIPVRIYTPVGSAPFPVLVFLHGGGWVIGDLDTHERVCSELCNRGGCIVVSVDYRLAPEAPCPGPFEDCWAATQWVGKHAAEIGGDPALVAVGGDSAGGNLAALVAIRARDEGAPRLVFQLLVYPSVDLRMSHPSVAENADGYLLTRDSMHWFRAHYVPDESRWTDPAVSPLLCEDLSGLPPALVITAEFDPLRDEGEEYGRRLAEAAVPVTVTRYDGQIHAFFQMSALFEGARKAVDEAGRHLRHAFAVR